MHGTLQFHYIFQNNIQRRIQDFPEGAPTPQGAPTYNFAILPNFPENCMESKEFGRPGGGGGGAGALLVPPRSANNIHKKTIHGHK